MCSSDVITNNFFTESKCANPNASLLYPLMRKKKAQKFYFFKFSQKVNIDQKKRNQLKPITNYKVSVKFSGKMIRF